MEEAWPNGILYAQALRHRLWLCYWPDDLDAQLDARTWLSQLGIEFGEYSLEAVQAYMERQQNFAAARELAGQVVETAILNTVQFYVKNIYRKLLVSKRVQAIEKAREMNLI